MPARNLSDFWGIPHRTEAMQYSGHSTQENGLLGKNVGGMQDLCQVIIR